MPIAQQGSKTDRVSMPLRGRGALSNTVGRFEGYQRSAADDGWWAEPAGRACKTTVHIEQAKSIISTNTSPDISFDQSINPYRGCEHGCSYCYARPTHAYLGHSPGLDFETQLYAKTNAAELLQRELSRPGYRPKTIALGAVTDPYQPIERTLGVSRQILEVIEATRHPVGIVTKSALIVRDIDILARLAEQRLVKVALSVTTLDGHLTRTMEPRAAAPQKRLNAIEALARKNIPVTVLVAPIVPALNDAEIETILEAAATAGAREAGYVLLRLPLELKTLFREWLEAHYPDRADRVLSILRSMHGGADYRAEFGLRQKGTGPYAQLISNRFRLALQRHGLNQRGLLALRTDLFRPPDKSGQMSLF